MTTTNLSLISSFVYVKTELHVFSIDFRHLSNLEHLNLNGSFNLVNEFLKSIGTLTSLRVLSLASCRINGTLPVAAGKIYVYPFNY